MKPHLSLNFSLFFLVILFSLILRLYQLAEIPGEWFGDISNVHEYTQQVMKGEWPFYFFQSPGPLYHYLIAPFIWFVPYQGYVTYKLASVLVGMLGILGTYLVGRELFSKRLGLLAAWVMSFSFWPLIWSRLGNSQVVIPVIFSFSLYFFIRYAKKRSTMSLLLSAAISSLGWYTYPQTFVFVPIFVFSYVCYLKITKQMRKRIKEMVLVSVILIAGFLPFLHILTSQPDNFGSSGYVGGKVLPVFLMDPKKAAGETVSNFARTLGMFVARGDQTFRVNVSNSPITDRASFLFLILGIIYLIVHKKHFKLLYLILLICFLILPAIVPGTPSGEIPSSSRTIAIQPIIYILISLGMYFIVSFSKKKHLLPLLTGAVIIGGCVISYANISKYFVLYPENLPEKNFAPGKKIAEYLDANVSPQVSVYFASCCWGAWGQPEPKAVAYVITKKRIISNANIRGCEDITHFPALVILNPNDKVVLNQYKTCFSHGVVNTVYKDGQILFSGLYISI